MGAYSLIYEVNILKRLKACCYPFELPKKPANVPFKSSEFSYSTAFPCTATIPESLAPFFSVKGAETKTFISCFMGRAGIEPAIFATSTRHHATVHIDPIFFVL